MEFDLRIVCTCGKEASLSDPNNKNLPISDIPKIFNRLVCSSCNKKRKFKIFNDDMLILDSQNFKPCENCSLPILSPRLDALPHTVHCTLCSSEKPLYAKWGIS